MRYVLIEPPTSEPFGVDDLRDQVRISHTTQDDILLDKLKSARIWVEDYMNFAFMESIWEIRMDAFPLPGNLIKIYKYPIQEITTIKYIDTSGVLQTWASDYWESDIDEQPGMIWEAYGFSYPSTRVIKNAVRIRIVAGWESVADIPTDYKNAVLMRAAHLFLNPSDVVTGTQINNNPDGSLELLRMKRVHEL